MSESFLKVATDLLNCYKLNFTKEYKKTILKQLNHIILDLEDKNFSNLDKDVKNDLIQAKRKFIDFRTKIINGEIKQKKVVTAKMRKEIEDICGKIAI